MAQEQTRDFFWEDPAPEIRGVLLSDAISYYVDQIRLIEDMDPGCLKPASYGLRLGSRYYCNGKFGNLREGDVLPLPRNSLTYVSMLEKVNIPHYMIARFNLRIELIYQGILLGTGPQVAPGFRGYLSCPLHNISNNEVELRYGSRFATIDFIKTSRFPSPTDHPELAGMTAGELYNRYSEDGVPGYKGKRALLFPTSKLERRMLDDYLQRGKKFYSSLMDFERVIKGTNKWNIGLAIALGTIFVSLLIGGTTVWWYQYSYFRDLRDRQDALIAHDAALTESRDLLKKRLSDLELLLGETKKDVMALSSQIVTLKRSSKSPSPPSGTSGEAK